MEASNRRNRGSCGVGFVLVDTAIIVKDLITPNA